MAVSWTLVLVLFDFGWRPLPGKAGSQIATPPFSQVRNGENPYRAQRSSQMDFPPFTASSEVGYVRPALLARHGWRYSTFNAAASGGSK